MGPFELENSYGIMIFFGVYHWSPLELEIVDECKSNLIKKLLITGVHWSWRIQMGSLFSGHSSVYHWSPLELEIVRG